MTMAHPDVVKWITLQLADFDSSQDRERITRFELYHTVEDSPAERLQLFHIDEGTEPQEIGQNVWETAENDAGSRAMGVPQRYVLWAYRGSSPEMEAQYSFSLRGKTIGRGNLDLGESSDPPTERGIIGAVLRHNEQLHRMNMLMTDATAGRLAAELQNERKRREEVEDKMMEVNKLQGELMDRSAERALHEAREQAKARRHDEMMGFFMSMMPILVAQFMGGKGAPAQTTATMRDVAISKMLKNLSQEEAMGVINSLKDGNKMAFMELYKSYAQDHAEEQEKKPIPLRDPKVGGK